MLIYMHLNLLIYFGYHSSEAYVVTSDEGHYRKLLQNLAEEHLFLYACPERRISRPEWLSILLGSGRKAFPC